MLAGLLAVAGCGSEQRPVGDARPADDRVVDISGTAPVGEVTAGSVAQLAACRDWNEASLEQKLATIEDVRSQVSQVSQEGTGVAAPALTDEEALEVLDSSCEPSWAESFRLYKIYARAAAFVPLKRAIEQQP